MKKVIVKMLQALLRIGNDKLLHVLFGIVIAEAIMLFPMTLAAKCIAAFVGVTIVELSKETLIDSSIDWKDILATEIGCVIGIALAVLNIMMI